MAVKLVHNVATLAGGKPVTQRANRNATYSAQLGHFDPQALAAARLACFKLHVGRAAAVTAVGLPIDVKCCVFDDTAIEQLRDWLVTDESSNVSPLTDSSGPTPSAFYATPTLPSITGARVCLSEVSHVGLAYQFLDTPSDVRVAVDAFALGMMVASSLATDNPSNAKRQRPMARGARHIRYDWSPALMLDPDRGLQQLINDVAQHPKLSYANNTFHRAHR
jgi:hypothetical protein